MKYLASDVLNDIVLPLIILAGAVAIALVLYFSIKRKIAGYNSKQLSPNSKIEVNINGAYITEKEMKFLEYLHRAMPKELIAFPKVGVDQVVKPKKDRVAFNSVMGKYVDVCVFLRKTMEPVMVIDLISDNPTVQQYEEMDSNVIAVLKAVKLSVLRIKLEDSYDIETLKTNILNLLPAKVVSLFKDNYISNNTK